MYFKKQVFALGDLLQVFKAYENVHWQDGQITSYYAKLPKYIFLWVRKQCLHSTPSVTPTCIHSTCKITGGFSYSELSYQTNQSFTKINTAVSSAVKVICVHIVYIFTHLCSAPNKLTGSTFCRKHTPTILRYMHTNIIKLTSIPHKHNTKQTKPQAKNHDDLWSSG